MGGSAARGVGVEGVKTISKKKQTFYFDEAGFTGNNLLDPSQPVFVYAGVAIDEDIASQLHADALSCYGIEAQELKGANLIRSRKGRETISLILENISGYCHLMVANKEYALAGKFFEYVFEPVLTDYNSLFYAIDFHKFIATFLYIYSRAGKYHVAEALKSFVEMMRSQNAEHFEIVLSHLSHFDQSDPIGMIFTFSLCHRNRIEDEIVRMKKYNTATNWSLELSMTALHWLLASWGEQFEVLEVYCDKSKPLQDEKGFLEALIGREDKAYIRLGNQPTSLITYNLSGPINLVDSKDSHGVQIADVVSSSLAYAYKNPNEDASKEWMNLMREVPANQIIPESIHIDLTQEGAFVNAMVLRELVDRSIEGQNLFENMNDLIMMAISVYPEYAREHNTLNAF